VKIQLSELQTQAANLGAGFREKQMADHNIYSVQATFTGALPLPMFSDESSISLRRFSTRASSCCALELRSGSRGQGSHNAIEDNVPDRIVEAGKLTLDAPRRCAKLRSGAAVCRRGVVASPVSSSEGALTRSTKAQHGGGRTLEAIRRQRQHPATRSESCGRLLV
jgi:hypothetical protein